MTPARLRNLLSGVRERRLSVADALKEIRDVPFEDLGFAKVDHHRSLRRGAPEAVFGAGKTPEQADAVARALVRKGQGVLITKAPEGAAALIGEWAPEAESFPASGLIRIPAARAPKKLGRLLVLSAGTTDGPVAEEACETARALGCTVERIDDVGVAGLHRLLAQMDSIRRAEVIVVVAGMDGALPSVVAGLADQPVVAVPTSVGYGAAFEGLAALLSMLNACSPGVSLVNIDNGFGAGYMAASILRAGKKRD